MLAVVLLLADSGVGPAAAGAVTLHGRQRAANADATTMAGFAERTRHYGALHQKVAGSLPALATSSRRPRRP